APHPPSPRALCRGPALGRCVCTPIGAGTRARAAAGARTRGQRARRGRAAGAVRPGRRQHGGARHRHTRRHARGRLPGRAAAGAGGAARGRLRVLPDGARGCGRARGPAAAGNRRRAVAPAARAGAAGLQRRRAGARDGPLAGGRGHHRGCPLRPRGHRPAGGGRQHLQRRGRRRRRHRGRARGGARPGQDAAPAHRRPLLRHGRGGGDAGNAALPARARRAAGQHRRGAVRGDDRPAGLPGGRPRPRLADGVRPLHHGRPAFRRGRAHRRRSPARAELLRTQRQHAVRADGRARPRDFVLRAARRLPPARRRARHAGLRPHDPRDRRRHPRRAHPGGWGASPVEPRRAPRRAM
ncbi:MAG: hypothetical protein AVDCRST_MAG89-395, partial [uncultured Gemmatimonadetes bacterium]